MKKKMRKIYTQNISGGNEQNEQQQKLMECK